MKTVSLVKTKGNTEADIDLAVRKSLDLIGGISDIIKPGYKVLIKPNMCAPGTDRLSGANTRYEVCKAIADVVRELGANPVIAESSAAGVDTEKAYKHVGYDKLRDRGYDRYFLNHNTLPYESCLKLLQFSSPWSAWRQLFLLISCSFFSRISSFYFVSFSCYGVYYPDVIWRASFYKCPVLC
jgi:hypothetical protein